MYIEALFPVVKIWKKIKFPRKEDWIINRGEHVYLNITQ